MDVKVVDIKISENGLDTKQKKKKKSKKELEKEKRENIKKSLKEQLERRSGLTAYNSNLIDDYMEYYDLKEKMLRDIKNRGLVITQMTGNGFEKQIVNENVAEVQKITRLMLKILTDLELNVTYEEEEIDFSDFT